MNAFLWSMLICEYNNYGMRVLYLDFWHSLRLMYKKDPILNARSKNAASEADFITKVWGPLFEAMFDETGLNLKWCAAAFKLSRICTYMQTFFPFLGGNGVRRLNDGQEVPEPSRRQNNWR